MKTDSKVKTDSWFQSCKVLKIDSYAKNYNNNDGHGGLLKAMIIYSEVVLQFAYQEKVTKMVIGGSQSRENTVKLQYCRKKELQ